MSLKDELTEIKGVGDATADKILEVIESHQPEQETPDIEDLLQDAYDYHQQGDYGFTEQYLREALESF